jgi:hypothetical protein
MSEIKRYEPSLKDVTSGEYEGMFESPNGEWVRWEDVQRVLVVAQGAIDMMMQREMEKLDDPPPP